MSPEINAVSAQQPAAGASPAPALPRTEDRTQPELAVAAKSTPQPSMPSVQFARDPDSGKVLVRVVNPDTGDVVRQIPSEDALALARALGKLEGVFLQQKV